MNHFHRIILFLIFMLTLPLGRVAAQCYVRLEDASGFDTDPYQAELQAAAAPLCALFDSLGFVDSFKVYDFGFYLHQEVTQGSYPEAFLQKLEQIEQLSPYHLVFGKQTDANNMYTKFWIKLKLPRSNCFSCYSEAEFQSFNSQIGFATKKAYDNLNNKFSSYHTAEVTAMDSLKNLILKLADCCFQYSSKYQCNFSHCYSADEVKDILKYNSFRSIPIEVVAPLSITFNKPESSVNNSILIDSAQLIIKINGEEVNIQDNFDEIKNFLGKKFRFYVTKNPQLCIGGFFYVVEQEYPVANNFDAVIWFHIDEDNQLLHMKWQEYGKNYSNLFGLEQLLSITAMPPYFPSPAQQNPPDRIYQLNSNGFLTSVAPTLNISSPATAFLTPKIRLSSGELISVNDRQVDDRLAWNYYYEVEQNPQNEITNIEAIAIMESNGFSKNCHQQPNPICRMYCTNYPFFFNYSIQDINQFYADGEISYKGAIARYTFAFYQSSSCRNMDYWCHYLSGAYKLPISANPLPCPYQYFLMEKELISPFYRYDQMTTAYNLKDFGNFIWGGAMKILGFSKADAIKYADLNEHFTDSEADKRAISSGYDNISN